MNESLKIGHKFILTLAIMTAATILQLIIWPYIEPAPILFFYPAILIASLYGEAFSAIILAAIAIQFFFIPPYGVMKLTYPDDLVRLIVFFPSAYLIKVIADNLLHLRKKLFNNIFALQDERDLREKFVSTLSHDLQTPLSAMKLSASLMINDPLDSENFNRNGKRLIKNMNRLENMIKDLLDANKIRAGKLLPVTVIEMDLNECIVNTVEELTHIFGDRFLYRHGEKLKGFWCEDAVQRILENLCTNAVKYGYQETPITITAFRTGDFITLTVHNFGPVIDRDEKEFLFEAFQRTRSAHLSKKKGWGLGLTLVKGLTEAMHGKLSVQSDHDTGTTFIVELPVDARTRKGILHENSSYNREQRSHRNQTL